MATGPTKGTPTHGPVSPPIRPLAPASNSGASSPNAVSGSQPFSGNIHEADFQFATIYTVSGPTTIPPYWLNWGVMLAVKVPRNYRFRQINLDFAANNLTECRLELIDESTVTTVGQIPLAYSASKRKSGAQYNLCGMQGGSPSIRPLDGTFVIQGTGWDGTPQGGMQLHIAVECTIIRIIYRSEEIKAVNTDLFYGFMGVISTRFPSRMYHEYNFFPTL